MKRKRKMGRPLLGDAPRDHVLQIRLTKKEHKTLLREAKKLGISAAEMLMKPWRKKRKGD